MARSRSGDSFDTLLDDIRLRLNSSKKSLVPGGGYVVDRDALINLLNRAVSALPEEIEQANRVISQQKTVLMNAEKEYQEKVQSAKEDAQKVQQEADAYSKRARAEAQAQAESYYQQKVSEGDTYYMQAQAQANQLIEQANIHAAQLVSEDEIMERAKIEAQELRDRVYDEMDELRANTFQYLDQMMAQMDDAFGQRQVDIRRLRQNLNVRSQEMMDGY